MSGKDEKVTEEVFVISVAAQLSGMHAQTLRTYDRLGLVTPARTRGGELVPVPRSTAVVMWSPGARRRRSNRPDHA